MPTVIGQVPDRHRTLAHVVCPFASYNACRPCQPAPSTGLETSQHPIFLASLLASHIARTRPKPCECHGLAYVFRGHGTANGSVSRPGAKLVDVARRSGVSTGTVSNVLNRPDAVAEPTSLKVLEAVSDLGYIRNAASGKLAAHWRRSGFATWLFRPAATGRYPGRGSQEERPVPVVAEPWPVQDDVVGAPSGRAAGADSKRHESAKRPPPVTSGGRDRPVSLAEWTSEAGGTVRSDARRKVLRLLRARVLGEPCTPPTRYSPQSASGAEVRLDRSGSGPLHHREPSLPPRRSAEP
ncbi:MULTISPECIES: LacI family DNA-binding transcriptional regulator [unclassified Streptomyces]|uniref:LacI family DNA-binding transcriptional regulator n=1 Tax=unclassified Streptomyces TaxID=2593676 RepID=UPI003809B7C3